MLIHFLWAVGETVFLCNATQCVIQNALAVSEACWTWGSCFHIQSRLTSDLNQTDLVIFPILTRSLVSSCCCCGLSLLHCLNSSVLQCTLGANVYPLQPVDGGDTLVPVELPLTGGTRLSFGRSTICLTLVTKCWPICRVHKCVLVEKNAKCHTPSSQEHTHWDCLSLVSVFWQAKKRALSGDDDVSIVANVSGS